jgi:hypothetical protein
MLRRIKQVGAQSIGGVWRGVREIWRRRRWIYGALMLIAVTRIPARTGFRLASPTCDTALTVENLALSLTKWPHVVLFGAFALITLIQFERVDRRSLTWTVAATAMFSFVIELQQGATRTGNCRLTDLAPNLFGALIVTALIPVVLALRNRIAPRRT